MSETGKVYALKHDYKLPERPPECDLVMKGGVTSGVIYPGAICKLAEHYRFRSIGGASAGAIAAACAAAAEHRRQAKQSDAGFRELASLPDELGKTLEPSKRTRLASLFQPAPSTEAAFDIAFAALSTRCWPRKALAIAWLVIRANPSCVLLGAVLAAAILWVGIVSGPVELTISILAAIVVLAAGFAGTAIMTGLDAYEGIAKNQGGMCLGYGTSRDGDPPLTQWLSDKLQTVAGTEKPPTFGDLAKQRIELVMMTTNLTHGRPHRVPFRNELMFFDEYEMRKMFPSTIVDALVAGGKRALTEYVIDGESPHDKVERDKRRTSLARIPRPVGYWPLPDPADLPVVFAVRLSLSFPVLLSAVPLYTVDFTLREEQQKLERCWFSDGGICSNLPIHFFDQLLPTRPTFALDLGEPHQNYPIENGAPETNHVFLASTNKQGHNERWRRSAAEGLPIAELIVSMVETMKNWNDNMTARAPGFRDRIARISHTSKEGGLNLDMQAEMITRLSERGAAAGHKLIKKFEPPEAWDNHLWIRYRTALGMLQPLLYKTYADYYTLEGKHGTFERLLANHTKAMGYEMSSEELVAARRLDQAFAEYHRLSHPSFEHTAPRPKSTLRARPFDS